MSGPGPGEVARRLAAEEPAVRRALGLLGELLTGASSAPSTASGFLEASLGRPHTSLVVERVDLTHTQAVSVGAAVADLVAAHGAELGPVADGEAPTWARIDLDGEHVSVPTSAAAHFPAGTAAGADVVIHLRPPEPAACARILDRYLGALAADVDSAVVAAALPEGVTGADLREVVRRAVLEHGRELSTARVRAVVETGRWRPAPLAGQYL